MSDVFKEVDEDLRREQLKSIWDRFGAYIIGAAVLIVVATAGYRLWADVVRPYVTGDAAGGR